MINTSKAIFEKKRSFNNQNDQHVRINNELLYFIQTSSGIT